MSNKYLEKVAGIRHYGRMAREAAKVGIHNPMTTAFGAGGAMDGLLSTRREGREGKARLGLRMARNTIVGGAKGAAAGKTLELAYAHLKTKAGVGPDINKFVEKAAALRKVVQTWEGLPTSSKLSLGVSSTGLSISSANYLTNKSREQRAAEQQNVDQQALAALRGIHRELKNKASL